MSARQFTVKTQTQALNGNPVFLGILTSNGTLTVNNATTATPFMQTPAVSALQVSSIAPTPILTGTLAGKVLLLQGTAQGFILPSGSNAVTMANQSTVPPAVGTIPGVLIAANERVVLVMDYSAGWLQWQSSGGAGNLFVWELV